MKMCLVRPNTPCTECGDCDKCDLNPQKLCDSCCKCLDDKSADYAEIKIDSIIGDGRDA